ncbi:MAG: hypothetical protein K0S61_2847, partial [Anaerocolumna sp.]|nr:hypothetical protein [Anaerocolumna sp.]
VVSEEDTLAEEVVNIPKTGEKSGKKIFWILGADISLFGIYLYLKKKG